MSEAVKSLASVPRWVVLQPWEFMVFKAGGPAFAALSSFVALGEVVGSKVAVVSSVLAFAVSTSFVVGNVLRCGFWITPSGTVHIRNFWRHSAIPVSEVALLEARRFGFYYYGFVVHASGLRIRVSAWACPPSNSPGSTKDPETLEQAISDLALTIDEQFGLRLPLDFDPSMTGK